MFPKGTVFASIAVEAEDGVERATPGGAPTAFRIWRAGDNRTDYGLHRFTEASAALLIADQATRGNLYSFDIDHGSLDPKAAPELHAAVGYHRVGIRDGADGPEFWAEDCEWSAEVRAGLEERPPKWKYFSPAYSTSKSGEITRYLNCAITINPATHFVTALASTTKGSTMHDFKSIAAAMLGEDGDEKEKARAAIAAMGDEDRTKCHAAILAAMFGEEGENKEGKDPGESKPPEKKEEASAAVAAAAAGANAPPFAASAKPAPKPATTTTRTPAPTVHATADVAELVAKVGTLDQTVAALTAENDSKTREGLLAARPDLTEGQRTWLAKKPLAEVRDLLASPVLAPPPGATANVRARAAQPNVQATRGRSQVGNGRGAGDRDESTGIRASMSEAKERSEIAARFGRATRPKEPFLEGHDLVLPVMDRRTAAEFLAKRGLDLPSSGFSVNPEILAHIREVDIQKAKVA
jgi:hypothetical protein